MHHRERLFLSATVILALALAFTWRGLGNAHARNASAAPEASKIAVLDILMIVEKLVDSERYRPARDSFQKDAADKINKNQTTFGELEAKFKSLPDDSPERPAIIQQAQDLRAEQQKIQEGVEKYNTDQVGEAYRLVIETASKLAGDRGYTHLLASRTDSQLLRSPNVQGAVQEMLARPILKMPAADDLTKDVMAELKISATPTAPAPADPAPAAEPKK